MSEAGNKEAMKYYAKALKLPTFADISTIVNTYSTGESLEDFVLRLMKREYEMRQANQQKRRVQRAGFPLVKTFEELDLTRFQHVKPSFIKQLASCDFVRKHENIVMIGNPGTGKTHLMIALGYRACMQGMKVIFKTATTLAAELKEARDSYQLRKLEKSIAASDLLLIDELSYAKFDEESSELLFKVIAERSERASTVITTNLEFSKWPDMFSNETLVAALVDRLTFNSHVMNMNGNSYRMEQTKKKMNSK